MELDTLRQAQRWMRRQLTRRADGTHPSHLAAIVLAEADQRFALQSCGVEGHAFTPSRGFQYLNYGDPYDPTIVIVTTRTAARVYLARGGWAPYAKGGF